jgi:small GTP-binding protein
VITRKVCLLGAFSVGKTSLVRRFVEGVFDERYLSTLGVKIDTKQVDLDTGPVKLVIWDIEGIDPGQGDKAALATRSSAYLMGVDAVLLVADGTRATTVDATRDVYASLTEQHPGIPVLLLLNKSDLVDDWQLEEPEPEGFPGLARSFPTSALSGKNVEDAFVLLAELLTG